jgi:hypothetical protein
LAGGMLAAAIPTRAAEAGTAVWLILFFIACAVVYSVEKLIYQFWT